MMKLAVALMRHGPAVALDPMAHVLAREQLADLQARLVKADSPIEAAALRYSIAKVRAALVEVEMVA